MTEMQIGDQTIRYDREATVAAYGNLEHGFAEECGCLFCKNFVIQRNLVYPPSFRVLLEQLGIDPNKEGEVFEYGPVKDGFHLYGGWFYFVGEMVRWGERNSNPPESHQFEFFFTSVGPNAAAFGGGPRLTIEFTTHVKWVLPDGLQYGTASEDERPM
jgi:hypothetical protein